MPKLINTEKTQCEHVPRPSTSLIKAVLFSPVDPWEKPWLQPVLKMLRNRLPANSQMHNWSQKSLCVIWSSFLSVQLSANWIVQQQWTACFLSQTEPGCSHATQRHFPHTAPRRHLNWEASMSASPDGWISHIWSMPVFTSRGNSYSYLRLEIRGWTGLANPPSKGWRSATDSRLLFAGPACTQTESQTFTTRGDSQRPVHLSRTSVDWSLIVPVHAQFRLRRCTKSDVNMCIYIYKHKFCFTDISGN